MTTYYTGDLEKDLLTINDDQLADTLKSIGESIGYGRAQQILQILWAKSLKEKGISTLGALIPKSPTTCEDMTMILNSTKLLAMMDNEELDIEIAERLFGIQRAQIDAWPWGVPEFSTDRRWAAAVVERMMFSGETTKAFDRQLERLSKVWGSEHATLSTSILVLTPDEICKAALMALHECGCEEQI